MMIKQIAEALCRLRIERNLRIDGLSYTEEQIKRAISYGWENFIEESIQVVQAMREPSKEMCSAAEKEIVMHAWSSKGEHITGDSASCIWQIMIDVILNEQSNLYPSLHTNPPPP